MQLKYSFKNANLIWTGPNFNPSVALRIVHSDLHGMVGGVCPGLALRYPFTVNS